MKFKPNSIISYDDGASLWLCYIISLESSYYKSITKIFYNNSLVPYKYTSVDTIGYTSMIEEGSIVIKENFSQSDFESFVENYINNYKAFK